MNWNQTHWQFALSFAIHESHLVPNRLGVAFFVLFNPIRVSNKRIKHKRCTNAKSKIALRCFLIKAERQLNSYSLEVSIQLLLAAAGPVEAVEGSLHKWGHDAPQADLVPTSVSLAIMLHA